LGHSAFYIPSLMDASRRLWPRSDLRVGDADRQSVVAELQRHYVEGRLTSEELGERVSHALAARTFADFSPLLQDLPTLPLHTDAELEPQPQPMQDDHMQWMSPPVGALLMLIGILALVWLFMAPGFHMLGFFPWPLFIWGFFIFGRPGGGRRRRF
jgi:hypothetical protein